MVQVLLRSRPEVFLFHIIVFFIVLFRVPTAQGKQGNCQKNIPCQGKHREFWKFCQNTGKTQGIWFAQVVSSLILKVKVILKFAAKIFQKCLKLDKSAKSVLCI